MPFEEAKAAVSKLDAQCTKQVELGRLVINRYGCFSCHEIKGFENTQPIGTELSEEGSKLVSRLDFAFVHDIPHSSKLEWFKAKLHDPRIFDQGRVLRPDEKLRMPNWDFADEEIMRLTTAHHELPARDSAGAGAAGEIGAPRFHDSRAQPDASPELRRLPHRSRAAAATT